MRFCRQLFICLLMMLFTQPYCYAIEIVDAVNSVNTLPGNKFIEWLSYKMKQYQVPGISIVVIDDYKISWVLYYGVTNVLSEDPISDSTLFQAGSLSKPITAVAVLKAAQDKKIDLDIDINDVLTKWKLKDNQFTQAAKVTPRGLMSHSAGINNPGFLGYANGENLPTLLDVLNGAPPANTPAIEAIYEPGEEYVYSGGGYVILQELLEETYQKSYAKIINQIVLQPLSMSNSTFQQPLPNSLVDLIAKPYRPNFESVPGGPHIYVETAATGLWTTAYDLAKFIISIQEALRGDSYQIITPEMAALMIDPEIDHMGLGVYVNMNKYGKPVEHGNYFMHSGQTEGYQSLFIANKKDGSGMVIMTNMSIDGKQIMSGKTSNSWEFIDAVEKHIADFEEWD